MTRRPWQEHALFAPLALGLAVLACSGELYSPPAGGSDEAETSSGGTGSAEGTGNTGSTGGSGAPQGTGGTRPIGSGTAYEQVALLIERSCALADCHLDKEKPAFVNDATLPSLLLDTVVEDCGNVPLVAPGQPESSAILKLVQRECGDLFMPDNCRRPICLPDADVVLLTDWIAAGAPM